jgi:hypothetical protein
MQEVFIFGVALGGVICILLTVMLLRLGDMIDRFPTDNEEGREKSLWSPREFTRISIILFWPLFGIGSFMIIRPDKIVIIGGIAILVGITLFLLTAVVFSFSVYNLMRTKKKGDGAPSPIFGLVQGFSPKKTPLLKLKYSQRGPLANRK